MTSPSQSLQLLLLLLLLPLSAVCRVNDDGNLTQTCVTLPTSGVAPADTRMPGDPFATQWVYRVDSCPPDRPDSRCFGSDHSRIRSLPKSLLELPAMSESGILFASGFCAECNGESHLLSPRVGMECERPASGQDVGDGRSGEEKLLRLRQTGELQEDCRLLLKFDLQPQLCPKTFERLGSKGDVPAGVLGNVLNFWIPIDRLLSEAAVNVTGNSTFGNETSADADEDGQVMSLVASIILTVSNSVSVASLLLLIAVYAALPHLRNRAGQFLMSHAVAALGVQVLQPVSRLMPGTFCLPIHFVFTFCFDSCMSWALLFGWDLLRTFSSLLKNSTARSGRYATFAAFGWGCPACVTILLIILHFTVGLLDENCVYTAGSVAAMITLSFAPLALMLAFNTIILVLLCRRLMAASRETRGVRRSAAANLGVMTAKVSIVMGVTWLPYTTSTIVGMSGVGIIVAEFFCSLHGLLLAIGFCGSRRVRAKLTEITASRATSSTEANTMLRSRKAVSA